MVEVTCDELLHLMLLGCSLIIMLGSILWWKFVFHGHADGYSKVKSIPILFLLIVCVSTCTSYLVSNKMVLDVHKHTYCIYFLHILNSLLHKIQYS